MSRTVIRASKDPLPRKEELVVRALMESVAFCIYDRNKVEEIFSTCRSLLRARCGITLDYDVTWNAPTINCDAYYANDLDLSQ